MLLSVLDGPVDLLQNRLLQVLRVAEIGPVMVVECQPEEVESQVGDVGEVSFIEQLSPSPAVGYGQVETTPARQLLRRGLGQLGTLLVRQQASGGGTHAGRRQCHAQHITAIHRSWLLQEKGMNDKSATIAPVRVQSTSDCTSPPRPWGSGSGSGQRAPFVHSFAYDPTTERNPVGCP